MGNWGWNGMDFLVFSFPQMNLALKAKSWQGHALNILLNWPHVLLMWHIKYFSANNYSCVNINVKERKERKTRLEKSKRRVSLELHWAVKEPRHMAGDPRDGNLMHTHATDVKIQKYTPNETHIRRCRCTPTRAFICSDAHRQAWTKAHTCAQQVCLTPVTQGRREEQRGKKKGKGRVK